MFEWLITNIPENLVKVWEKKNLKGRTLQSCLSEWRKAKVTRDKYKYSEFHRILYTIFLFAIFTCILFLLVSHASIFEYIAPMIAVVGLNWNEVKRNNKRQSADKTIDACESEFDAFKNTLKVLNPCSKGHAHPWVYNPPRIQSRLIELARNVLYSEEMFKAVRLDLGRGSLEVISAAERIDRNRNDFSEMLSAAESLEVFGVPFERKWFFETAERMYPIR